MRKNIFLLSCILLFVLINILYSTPYSVRKNEIKTNTSTTNKHDFIYKDNQDEIFANPQLSYPAPPAGDFTIQIVKVDSSTCQANGSITVIVTDVSKFTNLSVKPEPNTRINDTIIFNDLPSGICTIEISGNLNGNTVRASESVTVPGNYVGLSMNPVGNTNPLLGTLPVFGCQKGRFQIEITNGKFPYIVEIKKDGVPYDTVVFYTNQNTGESRDSSNYKNYYNIENLSTGVYTYIVKDQCFTLNEKEEKIDSIDICTGLNSKVELTSGYPDSSNIIKFKLLASTSNSQYYLQHINGYKTWWEYAYSLDGGSTYSSYTDMPKNGIVVLQDTLINKYCDVWNSKSYFFKMKVKDCDSDSCIKTTKVPYPYYKIHYTSQWQKEDVCMVDTLCMYVEPNSNNPMYYTFPLTVSSSGKIKDSLMIGFSNEKMYWLYIGKITKIDEGEPYRIIIKDANGCEIANISDTIDSKIIDSLQNVLISAWYSSATVNPCGTSRLVLNTTNSIRDSTVVELINSPESNKYHFKIEYVGGVWTIIEDTSSGRAWGDGSFVYLEDANMSAGKYQWRVRGVCGYDTISREIKQYRIKDSLTFTQSGRGCGFVRYKAQGQIVSIDGNGNETNEPTSFRIVEGPSGGYNSVGNNEYEIMISGKYIVQMYYSNYSSRANYGCLWNYDTVYIDFTPNIKLKRKRGYVCPNNTNGYIEIKVDSTTGVKPYNFTINYDGNVYTNTTGIFSGIGKTGEVVTVSIKDSCGISFDENITISTIPGSFVVRSNPQICYGDSLLLTMNNNFPNDLLDENAVFTWTGPNGFISHKKDSVYVKNTGIAESGTYKLKITGLQCDLEDSVNVEFIKELKTIINPQICKGYDYVDSLITINTRDSLPGEYLFEETVHSDYTGCDSTVIINLTINPTDSVVIDTIIDFGGVYNANGFNESKSGTYNYDTVNQYGCDSITTLNLKIRPNVVMPNAINPTDNSSYYRVTNRYRNQYGPIIGESKYSAFPEMEYEYKMIIFNRWNTTIFETNKMMDEAIDPSKHYWNGTHKGKVLPEDGYLYYIKIKFRDFGIYEKKGTVSIIYQ